MEQKYVNVIGFDDAPFARNHVGAVKIVGTVYATLRLTGVLIGEVDKDGCNAAERLIDLIGASKFAEQLHLILLQGITLAGFNVVDVFELHKQLKLPVLICSRKLPNLDSIREALTTKIDHGTEKWAIIERLGPMEPIEKIYVQRVGLSLAQAATVIKAFAVEGWIPEPIRVAHLIAGAISSGQSSGRA